MIRFAIRTGFWAFVALAALPSLLPGHAVPTGDRDESLAAMETTFHAARLAGGLANDLGQLCERNGAVCESGMVLAEAAAERAREGLAIAATMVDRLGLDDETTGSTSAYPLPRPRP